MPTSLRLLFALLLVVIGSSVHAADPPAPGSMREQFPTIDSVERADAALSTTAGAKGRIEREYQSSARECVGRILVNDCLDKARELKRRRLADVDAVELEANRYKRRDKADRIEADRARAEAARAAAAPADEARRAESRKTYDAKQAQQARDAAAAKASAPRTRKPALSPPPALGPGEAAKRAKNATDHAQRLKEADLHLKDIDRRSAERVEDRKRRAAAKAAKDAQAAR